MTGNPRVSVICPVFNAERFLGEAIESVVDQDYRDFELFLVDDGSTDGSAAIARDYQSRHPDRIRLLQHPGHENHGAAASRNLALHHAKGELVAFIDADDRWRPGKLSAQIALLDKSPQVGMVCGAVNYWRSWSVGRDRVFMSGDPIGGIGFPPATALRVFPLGRAIAPCPSDLLMRRSLVDEIGGFEPQFVGAGNYEDQAFLVKAYLAAPVYFATTVWLDYRIHSESGMARGTREGRHDAMRRQFLDWFETYVSARDFEGKDAIASALRRARWDMDHPRAATMLRRGRRLYRRFFPA